MRYQIQPGGRVNMQGVTMTFLIQRAWNLDNNEQLVNAPKWMDEDRFDIIAKAPTFGPAPEQAAGAAGGAANGPVGSPVDTDSVNLMLRKLLQDRFKLTVHNEQRPLTAYTLTAPKPKMKKADPSNRTGFHEGPGSDGKDPRTVNPAASRLVTCQNMTMAQFAENLPRIAGGYVGGANVLDSTGLDGAFDFTINFSAAGIVNNNGGGGRGGEGGSGGGAGVAEAPDPGSGITLQEALEKQLGLKLETTKRPGTVLVIDHAEQKPTDN
jgi:uncharacterized protein (TIGR03435 family)